MPGPKLKKLTPARRAEVDSAMEATDGTLTLACKVLGCNVETLKKAIRSDDILLRKWKPEWLEEDGADKNIHRPRQISGQHSREIALAKEEASLEVGFRELGYADDEIEYLVMIASFTNGRIESITDLLQGGMVASITDIIQARKALRDNVSEMSKDPDKYNEYNQKGEIIYSGWKKLKEARGQLTEFNKEFRATAKDYDELRISQAKIAEIKKRQMEDANKPNKVPGFGPPDVFGRAPKMEQHIHHHHGMKEADRKV